MRRLSAKSEVSGLLHSWSKHTATLRENPMRLCAMLLFYRSYGPQRLVPVSKWLDCRSLSSHGETTTRLHQVREETSMAARSEYVSPKRPHKVSRARGNKGLQVPEETPEGTLVYGNSIVHRAPNETGKQRARAVTGVVTGGKTCCSDRGQQVLHLALVGVRDAFFCVFCGFPELRCTTQRPLPLSSLI